MIVITDEVRKHFPNLVAYAEKYREELPPVIYLPNEYTHRVDDFYKMLLDSGKRWQDVIGEIHYEHKEGIIY